MHISPMTPKCRQLWENTKMAAGLLIGSRFRMTFLNFSLRTPHISGWLEVWVALHPFKKQTSGRRHSSMCRFYLWYNFLSRQDSVFLALTVGTEENEMIRNCWFDRKKNVRVIITTIQRDIYLPLYVKEAAVPYSSRRQPCLQTLNLTPFPIYHVHLFSIFVCISQSFSPAASLLVFWESFVSNCFQGCIVCDSEEVWWNSSVNFKYNRLQLRSHDDHTRIHIIWICLSSSQKLWHGCAYDLCHCGVSAVVQLSDVYLFSGLFIWQQWSASEEVRSVCLCALE